MSITPDPRTSGGGHGADVRWIATCPECTKTVLASELEALGARDLQPLFRAVAFEADLETGYRAHLALRTASRLQRVVADLPARSATELTSATAAMDWSAWLRVDRAFTVAPILTDAAARALGEEAVAAAVADGVLRSFQRSLSGGGADGEGEARGVSVGRAEVGGGGRGAAPRLDPDATNRVELVAHLRGGVCTLGLDTAGRALHKRGWRLPGHPAVLKETLAAAVLLLAGYDGSEPLLDPMCGSGTLAIEGAYIALRKSPLIHRGKDDFGLEHLANFDRALWRRVSDQARAAKLPAPPAPLFASDIRPAYVELARRTALRARVERHISFSTAPLAELAAPTPRGLMVANLPYGERIGRGELRRLCEEMGRALREGFAGWRAALLVPAEAPLDALGIVPRREIPLMNGALEVRLLLLRD